MSEFIIKKASRVGVIPLIDLYSESGCGKTMSALLLARGLAGPTGEITLIDTESRRGSLYADVIPGGFNALDLGDPFTPARYIAALNAVYATKTKVVVVDSMSHEWEGIGGVCDQATENETSSQKAGLHNWKQPKMDHQKLVQFLLRSPIPIICCIRAKYKTRQKKDDKGKTFILRDETTSPIQAEDFIFEATCHAEILPDHSIILTKCSHPSLRDCFPTPKEGPITIEHGQKIAKWCEARGETLTIHPTKQPDIGEALPQEPRQLKAHLWKVLTPVRGQDKTWTTAEQWLDREGLLPTGRANVSAMTVGELLTVIAESKKIIEAQTPDQGIIP